MTVPRGSLKGSLAPAATILLAFVCAVAAPAGGGDGDLDPSAWRRFASPSFMLLTDAPAETAGRVLGDLERFHGALARSAPALDLELRAPTEILAFSLASHFDGLLGGEGSLTGTVLGHFLAHPEGNFILLRVSDRLEVGMGVVVHEYVHQILGQNLPRIPLWLNEGLAEYYGGLASAHGGGATAAPDGWRGPVPRHLGWWRRAKPVGLDRVLSYTGDDGHRRPGSRDPEDAAHFYAVSWGLVHFLLHDETGAERLAELFERLHEGRDPERALYEVVDLSAAEFERRLRAHIGRLGLAPVRPGLVEPVEPVEPVEQMEQVTRPGLAEREGQAEHGDQEEQATRAEKAEGSIAERPLESAELLRIFGDLASLAGAPGRAERFYEWALAEDPEDGDVLSGIAWLRDGEGRLAEAGLLFDEAVAAGVELPKSHLRRGRHLIRRYQQDGELDAEARKALVLEARAAFAEARVAEPGWTEAQLRYAASHLLPGLDAADGLGAARRAVALAPTRPEPVAVEVRLLLKAGDTAAAGRLVEGRYAALAEDSETARLRDEVRRAELLLAAREAFDAERWQEGLAFFDRAIDHTEDETLRRQMEDRLERLEARWRFDAGPPD